MGWRNRLRTALAGEAATPDAAECAHANSANSANCSGRPGGGGQLAQSAQLTEGEFPGKAAEEGVARPANDPSPSANSPGAAALATMRAACEARTPALAGAFDASDVLADRVAVAAEAPGSPAACVAPALSPEPGLCPGRVAPHRHGDHA
jgi:hypothetical protein